MRSMQVFTFVSYSILFIVVCMKLPHDHLLLDSAPNLGPLRSPWENNKFENCWYKSVRILEVLKLIFQQFLNLSSSQRDMSDPILGDLSDNRWSGGIVLVIFMRLGYKFRVLCDWVINSECKQTWLLVLLLLLAPRRLLLLHPRILGRTAPGQARAPGHGRHLPHDPHQPGAVHAAVPHDHPHVFGPHDGAARHPVLPHVDSRPGHHGPVVRPAVHRGRVVGRRVGRGRRDRRREQRLLGIWRAWSDEVMLESARWPGRRGRRGARVARRVGRHVVTADHGRLVAAVDETALAPQFHKFSRRNKLSFFFFWFTIFSPSSRFKGFHVQSLTLKNKKIQFLFSQDGVGVVMKRDNGHCQARAVDYHQQCSINFWVKRNFKYKWRFWCLKRQTILWLSYKKW